MELESDITVTDRFESIPEGCVNVDFSSEQVEFRDEVRTWLEESKPRERRPTEGLGTREYDLDWQRKQFDAGWACISWPKEYGGRGSTLTSS